MDRSSCPTPGAKLPRRLPSASPLPPRPRARADGRRGRGSCSSTAAAPACRRAALAAPAVRSPSAGAGRVRAAPTPAGAARSRSSRHRLSAHRHLVGCAVWTWRHRPLGLEPQLCRWDPTGAPRRPVGSAGAWLKQLLHHVRRLVRPASPSGCRAVGSRRCPAGAPRSAPAPRTSRGPPRASLPSVVRKLPIITPLMPALTASCCSSPMFSTRPPQSRNSASGRISRKIAIHLTASTGPCSRGRRTSFPGGG